VPTKTNSPAWTTDLVNGDNFILGSSSPAAISGYANVTVPAGYSHGLPIGVSLIGGRWPEPRLLALAYAWERATHVRMPPRFLPTLVTAPQPRRRAPAWRRPADPPSDPSASPSSSGDTDRDARHEPGPRSS
jgi:hypothetical protein